MIAPSMCVSGIVGLGRRRLAGGKVTKGRWAVWGEILERLLGGSPARNCAVVPVPGLMRALVLHPGVSFLFHSASSHIRASIDAVSPSV